MLFFAVALIYSSVGHGGASGYLALLVLTGQTNEDMRVMALVLNLVVAAIAFLLYYKSGHFRKSLFLPLAAASVPFAWMGAHLHLPSTVFSILLIIFLLFSSLRLVLPVTSNAEHEVQPLKPILAIIIGSFIGFVSGLIGIGGGILLSPVLILGRWSTLKESAAIAAPFILVNSASALIVRHGLSEHSHSDFFLWIIAAFVGGCIGAYYGSGRLPVTAFRYVLSVVLIIATGKLIFS
jgi:uncharacterized membrane protein YfcA